MKTLTRTSATDSRKTLIQAPVTDGQLKQIRRVATDAAEKAINDFGLDKDGAQRVHARGNELTKAIHTTVTTTLKHLSVSDKLRNEEVETCSGYLPSYKPKGLNEQSNQLRDLFPGIGFPDQNLLVQIEKGEVKLPKNAESWFAIPNWMKNFRIFGTTYSGALLKVLSVMRQSKIINLENCYIKDLLDEEHIRQSARTNEFLQELSDIQGNPDILIVPAQFGVRHRGRSAHRAREVFLSNEFGLGAFATGTMLLTHPKRLQHYSDLWVLCDDEFNDPRMNACFESTTAFCFDSKKVKFLTLANLARAFCGSASGFVPQ